MLREIDRFGKQGDERLTAQNIFNKQVLISGAIMNCKTG
jgi:hypothetical protein